MRVVRPSLLASLALALLAPSAARGDVVCVRPGGGTIAGCDLVRPTIAGGIDDAFPGDVIRVAAGTYVEHVEIAANVTVEGGWNAAFTARNPAVSVTTIQAAEIDRSVVTIRGTAGQSGVSTPILDGFTITGGNSHTAHGGGIALFDSNATIRNCVVTANEGYLFGGGIYVRGGAPRLEGNRIEGNAVNTAGLGGGIALEAARAVLVDNVVADNRILDGAGHGGGVAASGGGPIAIRGGRIEGNESGPSCTGDSGGLYATGVTHIDVDGVRFEGNCAGSTWAVGAALFDGSPFTLSNCLVVQQGGANSAVLSVDDVSPGAVRNCTFVGGGGGSGLVVLSEAELTNDIFTGFATAVATDYDIDPPISSHNLFWNNTANTDANWSLGPTDQVADPRLDSTHHLTAASPAVDAGVRPPAPTYDVDGDPRVADGGSGRFRVDIGADERAGRGQRNLDLALASADLEIIGPGNPPENPGSSGSNDWIGRAVLGADVSGDGKDDLVVAAQDFADDFDTLNAGGRLFGLLHFGTRRTGTIDLAAEPADF